VKLSLYICIKYTFIGTVAAAALKQQEARSDRRRNLKIASYILQRVIARFAVMCQGRANRKFFIVTAVNISKKRDQRSDDFIAVYFILFYFFHSLELGILFFTHCGRNSLNEVFFPLPIELLLHTHSDSLTFCTK
jgi:hypothetical protein